MEQPLVTLGLILYKSKPYLRQCFASLMALEYPHVEILVADNCPETGEGKWLKEQYPDIQLFEFDNPGFSGGHNRLIRESKGKYYACLNVDMVFEKDWLDRLVKVLESDVKIACVGGKILKGEWEMQDDEKVLVSRSNPHIDSAGLQIFRSHRVVDRGQGEFDSGQFDQQEEVFGISGAAVVFRKEALDDVSVEWRGQGEYFDEQMFMYKEDVDLSYRFQLAGWKVVYVPEAVNWHDRTLGRRWWGRKSALEKYWSALHHRIFVRKHWGQMSFWTKVTVFWYELRKFCFMLIIDAKTSWKVWKAYWSLRSDVQKKSQLMPVRQSVSRWFS